MRAAKETARSIYREAADEIDDSKSKALGRWAEQSQSEARLRAMVELAKSEPGIPIMSDRLDRNPWLLNCKNGTVDLKTGVLRKHDPEDYITKIVPVDYDSSAECSLWEKFIDEIMAGNKDLSCFMQKAIGYALTGDISEQVFFIWWGAGANGKSTATSVMGHLLNDYFIQCPMSTLMTRQNEGGASNDIARLRGARMIVASEGEEGRRLNEPLIKALSGGDIITARFLYGEHFEFTPSGKIFLISNHKPVIKESGGAIWRRVRLTPFTVTIPEESRDKELPEKLKQELPGVLAWAVRGCLLWQQEGLGLPAEVQRATDEYWNEMDTVGQFMEDCAEFNPLAKVKAGLLYDAYLKWCSGTGEKELSSRAFSQRLVERGITKSQRTMSGYYWQGLRLMPEEGGKKSAAGY